MLDGAHFAVFYRAAAWGEQVQSHAPRQVSRDGLRELAEALFGDAGQAAAEDYLGIIDGTDLILQAYPDDATAGEPASALVVELLYPEADAGLRTRLGRTEFLRLLAALPARFDEGLLPGAQYVTFGG